MTVASTFTKLVSVVAGSSGIVTCSTTLPAKINDAALPVAIVIPGPAEWNEHAIGLKRQIRTYIVRVYVKPTAQGLGIDEGVQACYAPLNALGNTLLDNITLDNTIDEVRQPFRDSGIISGGEAMSYAGVAYHGFEYQIDITDKTT